MRRRKVSTGTLKKEDISNPTNFVHVQHVGLKGHGFGAGVNDGNCSAPVSMPQNPLDEALQENERNFDRIQRRKELPLCEKQEGVVHSSLDSQENSDSMEPNNMIMMRNSTGLSKSLLNISLFKSRRSLSNLTKADFTLRRKSNLNFAPVTKQPKEAVILENYVRNDDFAEIKLRRPSQSKPLPSLPPGAESNLMMPPLPMRWAKPDLNKSTDTKESPMTGNKKTNIDEIFKPTRQRPMSMIECDKFDNDQEDEIPGYDKIWKASSGTRKPLMTGTRRNTCVASLTRQESQPRVFDVLDKIQRPRREMHKIESEDFEELQKILCQSITPSQWFECMSHLNFDNENYKKSSQYRNVVRSCLQHWIACNGPFAELDTLSEVLQKNADPATAQLIQEQLKQWGRKSSESSIVIESL